VVLNWNNEVIPLLRQLATAKKAGLGGLFE
jgi:hypothetical protein